MRLSVDEVAKTEKTALTSAVFADVDETRKMPGTAATAIDEVGVSVVAPVPLAPISHACPKPPPPPVASSPHTSFPSVSVLMVSQETKVSTLIPPAMI